MSETSAERTVVSNIRVTIPSLQKRKSSDKKLTLLTAYDFSFARLLDEADLDAILVGDSLGNVIQGHPNTLPVTLEQMIYHCQCVTRGVKRALVIGDLPFLSYQVSKEQAMETAGRLIKEGLVAAVKLEGGVPFASTIEYLTARDIPVMGHVGLRPQAVHRMGGFKIQGTPEATGMGARKQIIDDAKVVAESGAFAIVLEGIPAELAQEITETVSVPTIGIGAGPNCDGQILVVNDLLGMNPEHAPKFVKTYASLGSTIHQAVSQYVSDVQQGKFP